MASNHLGSVRRGLEIIREFSHVVRFNNVRASIKLKFPDVENSTTKTRVARLIDDDYRTLTNAIQEAGCIVTATTLDERSLELCVDLGIPIVEISGAQLNDGRCWKQSREQRSR